MTEARCWVEVRPLPGWHNMALDAAMLDHVESHGGLLVRLYGWDPHCLSFGCHEPAARRYDVARIRALGLSCVRRPTGGRAVWHARELTYAVAAPVAALGDLPTAYATIHRWLAAALQRLGVRAALAARGAGTASLDAGPCFAAAVGGELIVDGRKVLGSAQRRGQRALLQHGSLLLEDDQRMVRELLRSTATAPPAVEAPLSRLAGRTIPFDQAAAAIRAELAGHGIAASDAAPNGVAEAAALHFDRFRSDDWTWHR